MSNINYPTAREVYETTFETDARRRLFYRDYSEAEIIKHDIQHTKDLFRALLNTLTPKQLAKVQDYLKYEL